MTIKRLAKLGVEVWSYMDGRGLTPRSAIDKVMGALTGFKDEAHLEDTAKRNYEAAVRTHSLGHVAGGRVYGYRNVTFSSGGRCPRMSARQLSRRSPADPAVAGWDWLRAWIPHRRKHDPSGLAFRRLACHCRRFHL
jgi:hypothetical protein